MRAQEVINHILNLPEFSRLKQINKTTNLLKAILKAVLGSNKTNLIRYAYIKEQCLYIYTKAPFATQELKHDSTIFMIKNYLNDYFKKQNEIFNTDFEEILQVKILTTKAPEPRIFGFLSQSMLNLKEAAKGDFKILCKDEELKEIFEKIKQVIKAKNA